MNVIDTVLDAALFGYTRLGFAARGLSVDERFPEIAGKHVLVTGATRGIGRAAVERLASNGAVVHAVGRDEVALARLVDAAPGTVVPHAADLSLIGSIVELADSYVMSGDPLHGFVNNVGVMPPDRVVTPEGFELTYATNLLGQYVLTHRLLPALTSEPSRVVLVSSGGMYSTGLTADNIDSSQGDYSPTEAYARTKRGQVALAEEWAHGFGSDGVSVNAMHPGWVDTAGVRSSLPRFHKVTRPLLRSPEQGADTIVWLIASDEASDLGGQFFHDRRPRPIHRLKRTQEDEATRAEFMERLARDAAPFLIEYRQAEVGNADD